MTVPDSFKNALADFNIDVRGQDILEVGAGNGAQAEWLAMLGAKQVVAIDPMYANGRAEQKERQLPQECAGRVSLLPHTIENHIQRGHQYPIVMAFQAYPYEWESYVEGVSNATQDNGVALIMMDKFIFDQMPKDIFEKYFKDVRLQRCGGGDFTAMESRDEFFLMDLNRYAFVCRGPKRNIEIAQSR